MFIICWQTKTVHKCTTYCSSNSVSSCGGFPNERSHEANAQSTSNCGTASTTNMKCTCSSEYDFATAHPVWAAQTISKRYIKNDIQAAVKNIPPSQPSSSRKVTALDLSLMKNLQQPPIQSGFGKKCNWRWKGGPSCIPKWFRFGKC